MDFLTQLGIPHTSAEGPQGTSIVFPHVAHADLALATLTGSGFTVTRPAPRCLFIAPVAMPSWRERHPSAHRVLFWSVMVLILPAPYFGIPVYAYFGIRWYVRRHGKPRAMRPGSGKRRAPRPAPAGYYAGSPATPWYADHAKRV